MGVGFKGAGLLMGAIDLKDLDTAIALNLPRHHDRANHQSDGAVRSRKFNIL
jgi:hypothetical protein